MRLLTFEHEGEQRVGVATDDGLIDVTRRTGLTSVRQLLAAGLDRLDGIGTSAALALDAVRWAPPVPDPVHIVGIGLNPKSHFAETLSIPGRGDDALPHSPRLFTRSPLGQVAHGEPLWV